MEEITVSRQTTALVLEATTSPERVTEVFEAMLKRAQEQTQRDTLNKDDFWASIHPMGDRVRIVVECLFEKV